MTPDPVSGDCPSSGTRHSRPLVSSDVAVLAADTVVLPGSCGPGWIGIAGERIVATGIGRPPRHADRELGATVVVPGFVDLHVHGGGGAAYMTGDPEEAARAVAFHRAHGTTTTLASLVTATPRTLRRAVAALAGLVQDGEIAGVHLEGPWLAEGRCGAHDPALLRDPDPAELDALLGTGVIRMVTLAPEREGGLDAVRRVAGSGALAAVGHTDAGYALVRAAIEAGARVGTHLFNAMAPLHHREPGPAAALLGDPRVTVELVTDGLHVHPALWELVLASAGPSRVAAVSDAMVAAGMPDGRYRLGELDVRVDGGVARLTGRGSIAGSTATGDALFRRIVENAPDRTSGLVRAVAMTASTPAATLGLPVGVLEPGRRADVVVLSPELEVREVYRRGARLAPPA
ncbi:N-acetylglucosamine-6-phosphate deacetylase [Pseudonocardia halophobica]|uniref:N-acetylglucosamine-6-phosphate deacetylase n=1 Tax=Pseudonocardia halophobica TaxID=29401 RepID=A0A9W6NV78_9PSEU|nr:N-acetylglucosamine-6-phosphate deacetylase [Pseudonocardia halophobica]